MCREPRLKLTGVELVGVRGGTDADVALLSRYPPDRLQRAGLDQSEPGRSFPLHYIRAGVDRQREESGGVDGCPPGRRRAARATVPSSTTATR